MIKKKTRFVLKVLYIMVIKFLNYITRYTNLRFLPSLSIREKYNLEFSQKTRRYILRKNSKKFGKIIIDSTSEETQLCR